MPSLQSSWSRTLKWNIFQHKRRSRTLKWNIFQYKGLQCCSARFLPVQMVQISNATQWFELVRIVWKVVPSSGGFCAVRAWQRLSLQHIGCFVIWPFYRSQPKQPGKNLCHPVNCRLNDFWKKRRKSELVAGIPSAFQEAMISHHYSRKQWLVITIPESND